MLLYRNADVQIPCFPLFPSRITLSFYSQNLVTINASRNIQVYNLFRLHSPFSLAYIAGFARPHTLASAFRTHSDTREGAKNRTLNLLHFPCPAASETLAYLGAGFSSHALASRAHGEFGEMNMLFGLPKRGFQRNLQFYFNVAAAFCFLSAFRLASSKEFVENIANILKVETKTGALFGISLRPRISPCPSESSEALLAAWYTSLKYIAKPIVLPAFRAIGKHLIGFVDFLEFLLISSLIWVILVGELAIRLFNIFRGGVSIHSENVVIIFH